MSITNFEDWTHELTEEELELIPIFKKALKLKIGKSNAITNSDIQKGLEKNLNIKLNPARIRKIIQYIRLTGKVERLIASSKGYYISNDKKEIIKYIESLMQRADMIQLLAKQLQFQIDSPLNPPFSET